MLVLVEVAMSPDNNPLLCRCWDSIDARPATPTRLSFKILEKVAEEIIRAVHGIVSVTYNIASKPPSTIEVI